MYNAIDEGLGWFFGLITHNILAIIAVSVVVVALVLGIVFRKHLWARRVIIGLGWTFLVFNLLFTYFGSGSPILGLIVVLLVHIITWICFWGCACGCGCMRNKKCETSTDVKNIIKEGGEEMPGYSSKVDGIEWKHADNAVIRDANNESKAVLAQRRATLRSLEEQREKMAKPKARSQKPKVEKKAPKKAVPLKGKTKVDESPTLVQDSTKPLFQSVTVVPGTKSVETKTTEIVTKQVAGKGTVSVTSSTTSMTELKAKKESMKVEYARLEKKLEELRGEKLRELGSQTATVANSPDTNLPSYIKPPETSPYHGTAQSQQNTTQRYDEQEVREALFGLKSAMNTLQRQIDERADK